MINLKHFHESNFIVTVLYGKVTSQELRKLIDDLIKIDCNEGMRGLVVLCKNLKASELTYDEIFSAGRKMRQAEFRKNGKNAIIAKTPLGYGLSRIYAVATEIIGVDETKVYKEKGLDEAIKWLDVDNYNNEINEQIRKCESAR